MAPGKTVFARHIVLDTADPGAASQYMIQSNIGVAAETTSEIRLESPATKIIGGRESVAGRIQGELE